MRYGPVGNSDEEDEVDIGQIVRVIVVEPIIVPNPPKPEHEPEPETAQVTVTSEPS
jgi:hypothetical protein